MSQLLATLVTEHEHIRRVITALHDYAAFHAHDDPDVRSVLGQFVTYLREYVDGWHHHKEEDVLFVAMERAGLPRDTGPLACMLAEHDRGRRHVAMIALLAGVPGPLTAEELAVLGRAVLGYAGLLTAHIIKEDQMLYPLAQRLVPADQLAALDQADALTAGDAAVGRRLEALGDAMVARYTAARL